MTLDQINKLIKSINDTLIHPSNFPLIRKGNNVAAFIKSKENENWMLKDVFEETIFNLAESSKCHELIVAEDFERYYKSSGKTVRLNDVVLNHWQDFSCFCAKSEMISFYVFDHSLSWCAWFNDSYWCLVFDNSFQDVIAASCQDVSLAYDVFPEADSQFKLFIDNLYGVS